MSTTQTTALRPLTLEQKRDFLGRALAFLDEAAGEGVSSLEDRHDPATILMELGEALGLDNWHDARKTFLEQLT